MNQIELFAVSSGLSIGIETAGLDLIKAIELSPMSSGVFVNNTVNADLAIQTNI